MKPLCAICVRHDAYALHEIDGKDRPVCRECANEEVAEPDRFEDDSPMAQTYRVIRHSPGLSFVEIRQRLGIEFGGGTSGCRRTEEAQVANRYSKAVERLAKEGRVLRRGQRPNWTYWPARSAG